ncbi:MAG: nitroreductase family protein [Pseudomonadota bacterium]
MTNNPVTDFLLRRRSVVAKKMIPTAPLPEHLQVILDCGLRVPDHSNVQPWKIVVISGDARADFDNNIILPAARARADKNGEALTEVLKELESSRMQRSGVVIAVLCQPTVPHKIPEWEQQLSCGAVCSQMLVAAQSYGYAAQWLTEWPAYNVQVVEALGGDPTVDRIAGFIHIGAMEQPPAERKRPVKDDIVSHWQQR